LKHSLNPFDELALEAAIRLRELPPRPNPPVSTIVALSIGPPKAADVLRTAMALGADRAILVETPPPDVEHGEGELEPLAVAKLLREVVKNEGVNMVLMGKQSIDGDHGQTGQMLAGLLGWGQATQACDIAFEKDAGSGDGAGRWMVKREVDGGVETLGLKLPAVITADLRLNEPRYASLGNIMKAKRKVIEKKTLADYGVDGRRRLKTVRVEGESSIFSFLYSLLFIFLLSLLGHVHISFFHASSLPQSQHHHHHHHHHH
jgi:electron transfer flavoprotein beta subunit